MRHCRISGRPSGTWAVPVASGWRPPTDVYETVDELIVLIEAAGVTEEDLSVTLSAIFWW